MVQTKKQPVSLFENLDQVNERLDGKEVFVFLDYDGTLTPIVETPDKAVLSDEMYQAVRELANYYRVSIISGRATDDVRSKVKIDGLFYAGSHGFEIVHPDGKVEVNKEVGYVRPLIDQAHKELSEQLKDVQGALVEHVKYTISAHYRLVGIKDLPIVKEAVEGILRKHKELRKTEGKKVFEIRPNIDWNKGKAVEFILRTFSFDNNKDIAIYVGDDTTDEDAFQALQQKGFGILVTDRQRTSGAAYTLKDTDAVKQFIRFLVDRAE